MAHKAVVSRVRRVESSVAEIGLSGPFLPILEVACQCCISVGQKYQKKPSFRPSIENSRSNYPSMASSLKAGIRILCACPQSGSLFQMP